MAKKRANGEGSLRRKENGHWEVQIMVGYRADGSRDIRSFSAPTQKEAKAKMHAFLKKREAGLLKGEDTRFDEWADIWYENHQDNIKPTTQESYRYTLRILKDHFGKRKLTEIKAMDIEQFLKKLRKDGKSDSSLAQCRGMLYQILNKAAANDLIVKNPVQYADKMRKGPPKRKESFNADEVRLKGSIAIGTPKSYDSYRTIPVPEMVQYCARLLRDTDKKFVWEVGKPNMPCNPSYFSHQFKEAVGSVEGVRVLTPHCCRHTFVSMMQMLGVDLETIQNIAGHAEIDMTRHYLHVQEPRRLDAAQRFSDAFSKKGRGVHGNILDYKKSS